MLAERVASVQCVQLAKIKYVEYRTEGEEEEEKKSPD